MCEERTKRTERGNSDGFIYPSTGNPSYFSGAHHSYSSGWVDWALVGLACFPPPELGFWRRPYIGDDGADDRHHHHHCLFCALVV